MRNKKNNINAFDIDNKYKLYRNVYEIIHPTISKKNISNYKIVLTDDLSPLRIFYPNKVSSIKSAIVYIHGEPTITGCNNSYSKICDDIAKKCDKLVIALDYIDNCSYQFPDTLNKCYDTVNYLYKELEKNGIKSKEITLMGDSIGGNLVSSISILAKENKDFKIDKEVLIYPILNNEPKNEINKIDLITQKNINNFFDTYINSKKDLNDKLVFPSKNDDYTNMPKTLIVIGKADFFTSKDSIEYYNNLKKDNKKATLLEISFASHGFLNSNDDEIMNEFYTKVNEFLK